MREADRACSMITCHITTTRVDYRLMQNACGEHDENSDVRGSVRLRLIGDERCFTRRAAQTLIIVDDTHLQY